MDATETPLPLDAVKFAREWLKLTPEVRGRVADMVREMVKASSADQEAISDDKVADAYGQPGRHSKRSTSK